MGKLKHISTKGVGEIDKQPRNVSLHLKVTEFDYQLLCKAAKKRRKSKSQVAIELFRKYLSDSAEYRAVTDSEPSNNQDI